MEIITVVNPLKQHMECTWFHTHNPIQWFLCKSRILTKAKIKERGECRCLGFQSIFIFLKLAIRSLGVDNRWKENSKVLLFTGYIPFWLSIKSILKYPNHYLGDIKGKERDQLFQSLFWLVGACVWLLYLLNIWL